MAQPSEKLAGSLSALKELQDRGCVAIRTNQLSRTHRQRLLKTGFIREVMKGWYTPNRPDEPDGESTGWYASFWAFSSEYLNNRFGDNWCLSPEQSLSIHIGDWTVPKQLLVRSTKGGNKPTELLFGTSIFDVRLDLPPAEDREIKSVLRIFNLPAALIACSPGQFADHPDDLRAALAMVAEPSDLLRRLLEGGRTVVAGRLAGGFRNIGRNETADQILRAMRAAGHEVSESDPFKDKPVIVFGAREISPYVNRLKLLWASMRAAALKAFPPPPSARMDAATYLKQVDELYANDAYNSLSIEGYRVSKALIERVRSGNWNPDNDENDRQNRNALAARGYWQAFQRVKKSLEPILAGKNPGVVVRHDYDAWYAELFGPSVTAGILKPADLAGFRSGAVYIRRSMHVPPSYEAVRELMPEFFDLLTAETEPAVRVVLGHFVFVYIHPYMDGNGRMGRFLMNTMMGAGGYPWTIIPVERRTEYMASLEAASVGQNIAPFAKFLASLVRVAERGTQAATSERTSQTPRANAR
ncbi:MAG: Fic family protein [Proteobacteria bacterium]|nr:Fic family protein [Pseudomonadota bacterium]